jgi:eukaryotic-like serine/threonine-protein kinase
VPLSPGTRLGPYEVLAPLGAGGIGEAWKARDARLDRTVAIKVLPAALALDPAFRARFDGEARTISQLSHPHVCALYDVGECDGTNLLVLEYLEGETLATRLERGPLPIEQAVRIAVEIADALAAAHRAWSDIASRSPVCRKICSAICSSGGGRGTSENFRT